MYFAVVEALPALCRVAVDIDLQEAIQEHEDAQVNVDQATCMSLVL